MATSSITQSILIRDRNSGRQLISALENADKKRSQEVTLSKTHREIRGEAIKELFRPK